LFAGVQSLGIFLSVYGCAPNWSVIATGAGGRTVRVRVNCEDRGPRVPDSGSAESLATIDILLAFEGSVPSSV